MLLLLVSFIAGILTVLAPCILPLLPIIVGGSLTGEGKDAHVKKVLTIVLSLGVSVIAFTFLLKVSTIFINIPDYVWKWISGGIIIILGLITVFPSLWEGQWLAGASAKSNKLLSAGDRRNTFWGDVLVGVALGPVFSTCSPTYFIILATVLPVQPIVGAVYLLTYVLGLCLSLFLIAFVGQKIMSTLNIAANPRGWIKRSLGVLFLFVGIAIITGIDKQIETAITSANIFDVTKIEQRLLQSTQSTPMTDTTAPEPTLATTTNSDLANTPLVTRPAPVTKTLRFQKAHELVTPDGYLNTGGAPLSLGQLKGKKVVLIDFWTYSCINCQRTIPYVNAWYDKYKSQGLEIIGVHTPEFAFEHVEANVADALKRFNITHPVVLDNQYQTWNAFGNQFWPHMYLIDIDGYIVYDHIGEGNYAETEKAIQDALKERADALGTQTTVPTSIVTPTAETASAGVSPETYFGASRNNYLGNGKKSFPGIQTITLPSSFSLNTLYLGGTWDFGLEKATADAGADVVYTYNAKEVYLVAGSDTPADIEVYQDGVLVSGARGADVNASGIATIGSNRLYKVIKNTSAGKHTLRLHIKQKGIQFFTFTFG